LPGPAETHNEMGVIMNRTVKALAAAIAVVAGTQAASSQEIPPDVPPEPVTVAYEKLSPGHQMIVDAIFSRQAEGGTLTRDDIAALKDEAGWGKIYKRLHADGLVTERNLGQAIRAYHGTPTTGSAGAEDPAAATGAIGRQPAAAASPDGKPEGGAGSWKPQRGTTVITTGDGRSFVAGKGKIVTSGFHGPRSHSAAPEYRGAGAAKIRPQAVSLRGNAGVARGGGKANGKALGIGGRTK
jgi:hypothetical protein